MGVLKKCKPRKEILSDELSDALFAADFGQVVDNQGAKVYRDPKQFFQTTHPTIQLKKTTTEIFKILANKQSDGTIFRLSTGFGGGKTHALIALYHLGKNIGNGSLGLELLPAAGRPSEVNVVAIDAAKAGFPEFSSKNHTHSFHAEMFYKLGGKEALKLLGKNDKYDSSPDTALIEKAFPKGPTLILIDELVVYLAKAMAKNAGGNVLGFLRQLATVVSSRKQAVLVITDPANQVSYMNQAQAVDQLLASAAQNLGDESNRWSTDRDPIGKESAQVIARRLFERIDSTEAQRISAEYHKLHERIKEEHPELVENHLFSGDYAKLIVENYPFHPRLVDAAKNRVSLIPEFNQTRGVLRLFGRIIRDIWDAKNDLNLIGEGDINWESDQIQSDLIQRLNRDSFRASIEADVVRHAQELDQGGKTAVHQRVARALLFESLPLDSKSGMDSREITEAVINPDDAGDEAADAMERLAGVCWHLYPREGAEGYQFRYEENVLRKIETLKAQVPQSDAETRVRMEVYKFFHGSYFTLHQWPDSAKQVPNKEALQLALCATPEIGDSVVKYEDDSDPNAPMPRKFRNSILAVSPRANALTDSLEWARKLIAMEQLQKQYKTGKQHQQSREHLEKLRPQLVKGVRVRSVRAFNVLHLPSRSAVTLEEKYQVPDDEIMRAAVGQENLKTYLKDKQLIFEAGQSLDVDRFVKEILPGTTPTMEDAEVFTAKNVHERFLGAKLDRLIADRSIVRETILKAVHAGKIVVKQSNGDCFDAKGCVEGVPGSRKRTTKTLSTLAVDDSEMITLAGTTAAKTWLAEDSTKKETKSAKPDIVEEGPANAITWDEAIELAGGRNLLDLKLSCNDPTLAQSLSSLAMALNPDRVELEVYTSGKLNSGGTLVFKVSQIKPSHPMKPLEVATKVFNSAESDQSFMASVILTFGADGRGHMAGPLKTCQDQADDAISVSANYAEKSGS
jgi:hypothetical protein